VIKIDTLFEFRKGILFIRLKGVITKNTINEYQDIIFTIKDNGFKNIVINLEKIYKIDLKGINSLFYTYEIVNKNKGKLYLTNINNLIKDRIEKSHILRYVKVLNNELEVLNIMGGI
jgi:anti-anti-sigma factor